jgi:hypothetical protein
MLTSTIWSRLRSVGQRMERRNKDITRNEESGQTNWWKEENCLERLQRTASEGVRRQLSYYQLIGRHDPGRQRRRWLDGLIFEDGTSSQAQHWQTMMMPNKTRAKQAASKADACFMLVSCLAYSSTLKMEEICFSETSVDFQQATCHHIPEDRTIFRINFYSSFWNASTSHFRIFHFRIKNSEILGGKATSILNCSIKLRWGVNITLRPPCPRGTHSTHCIRGELS